MQDLKAFAFVCVELHEVIVSLFLLSVFVPLNRSSVLQHADCLPTPPTPIPQFGVNLLRMLTIPSSMSLMNIWNSIGLSADSWGMLLFADCWLDFAQVVTTVIKPNSQASFPNHHFCPFI